MKIVNTHNFINTDDIVTGDIILFTESVFEGSYSNPKFKGERNILAKITKESYGEEKQQHTFTLEVLDVEGTDISDIKQNIRRKGRNIYRNGVKRQLWANEKERNEIADEKHLRGSLAREKRRIRKEESGIYGF